MLKLIWLATFCAAVATAVTAESDQTQIIQKHPNEITDIPGLQCNLKSRHYGGYITVDADNNRNLYYYFVTSKRKPAKDPLILWLNGGPGCSSFDGFIYEHGPFEVKFAKGTEPSQDGRVVLHSNPFSWSKTANIIYLDSPAGTGMSYSETRSDYVTNDTHTAQDSNKFIRGFLEQYPQYAKNDFYIIGESYAGVYVPTLAQTIVAGNADGQTPEVNIQGYAIGNGVTDDEVDGNAIIPFAYGKALLSTQLYMDLMQECNGSFWNATKGTQCDKLLHVAYNNLKDINLYDILWTCYHGSRPRQQALMQARASPQGRAWPLGGPVRPGLVPTWSDLLGAELGHVPPCLDSREMWAFANNADIRKAIHAEPISKIGRFDECSDRITYTHDTGSMIPIHADLVSKGLRVLIYSGDHDMCVPHTGSEAWTQGLGLKVQQPWHPWKFNDQVAGFIQHFEGLSYATVKGAGHMVGQAKPAEALHLIDSFLRRDLL
uniref:Carboxypeptidase n=1 Tax=Trebouxia lynnae TaxID=1825957 RepID=A0A7L9QF00_9CHLO|nr:putative extracellular protein TR9_053b [Trebouxia lynnae]